MRLDVAVVDTSRSCDCGRWLASLRPIVGESAGAQVRASKSSCVTGWFDDHVWVSTRPSVTADVVPDPHVVTRLLRAQAPHLGRVS